MRRFFTAQRLRFTRIAAVAMFLLGGPGAARSALALETAMAGPEAIQGSIPNPEAPDGLVQADPDDSAMSDDSWDLDDPDALDGDGSRLPNWEDGPQINLPRQHREAAGSTGHDPKQHPNWEDGPKHHDSNADGSGQTVDATDDTQQHPNWEDGPQILSKVHGIKGNTQGSSRHSRIPVLVLSPLTISVPR